MGRITEYMITFNQTRLTSGLTDLYISGEGSLFDSQYSRIWNFKTNGELPITFGSGPEKVCFYIKDAAEDNIKIQMRGITNGVTADVGITITGEYYLGNADFSGTYNYNDNSYGKNYTYMVGSYSTFTVNVSNYTTNVPVFVTVSDADDYLNDILTINDAINGYGIEEPPGEDFEIINPWTHGTWTEYGVQSPGITSFRNVRGKIVSGKFALYPVEYSEGDTDLKLNVVSDAQFYGLQYSTDNINWTDTEEFPFNFFYKTRESELGTFNYGLSISPYPIFSDRETAEGYIEGSVDISEADNWGLISPLYPIHNETGDGDDVTEFGQVFTKSFFAQQYICSESAIEQIAAALYDTGTSGVWENIKKGLEMFGQNPMDAVVSLMYYPVDLNSIFTSVSNQSYVYFGGYKFDFTGGVSVNKILYPNGSFNIGGNVFMRSTNSWRDLPPYTRVFVDLPYCGRYEIDPTLYYGKILSVKYFIDTHTGGCVACLMAGDHCYDQFNGQIGTQLPITLTNFSEFANAQINTLLGGGGQAVNSGLNLAGGLSGATSAAALGGAAATAAGLGAVYGAKTVYGLAQNNINKFNKTRGGSSAMLNQYLNQKVTITFETMELDNPSNYNALKGQPSNKSGNIGSFSGYFEAEQVKLNLPGATESEKDKVRQLLMNGVYLT